MRWYNERGWRQWLGIDKPGGFLSGFSFLQSSATAWSFDSERPAIAHFTLTGKLAVMYSAAKRPV